MVTQTEQVIILIGIIVGITAIATIYSLIKNNFYNTIRYTSNNTTISTKDETYSDEIEHKKGGQCPPNYLIPLETLKGSRNP